MKQKLLDLIGRHAQDGATITLQSRLREDLDLNSLSMMMILWEAEQILGKELDLTKLSTVRTVEDFFAAVQLGEE